MCFRVGTSSGSDILFDIQLSRSKAIQSTVYGTVFFFFSYCNSNEYHFLSPKYSFTVPCDTMTAVVDAYTMWGLEILARIQNARPAERAGRKQRKSRPSMEDQNKGLCSCRPSRPYIVQLVSIPKTGVSRAMVIDPVSAHVGGARGHSLLRRGGGDMASASVRSASSAVRLRDCCCLETFICFSWLAAPCGSLAVAAVRAPSSNGSRAV